MDFSKNIWENRNLQRAPLLAAHRGVNGANIPCNTLLSYKIAVAQGADVVEIDVSKSRDGKLFVFHPGMEPVYLSCGKYLWELDAKEIENLPILNCDNVPTRYRIPSLREVFALLKDKVYINVDKFWTDVEGITREIREAGVEKQVIVKTQIDEESLSAVEKYAPDLMFMPLVRGEDKVTDLLQKRNIYHVGNEILFETEQSPLVQKDYIDELHRRNLLVWMNAIVYNEAEVISAGHTDDASWEKGADYGWGWLFKRGADVIQTDWLSSAKAYLNR